MTFPVTTLYALPLALIFLVLWFGVTKTRATMGVSIGDAGNTDLHERIRRHGNFVEWVPLVLILMLLAEAAGSNSIALHSAGGLLVVGRVIHPFGLRAVNPTHLLRILGNSSNLLATGILIVLLAMTKF